MDCPQYTKEQLSAFHDLPSGVLVNVINENGEMKYAYSNPFLANSLGYTHEEFVALLTADCFAAIYDPDREKTQNARAAVSNGKTIIDSITRQKKKDGSFVWILAHIRPILLEGQRGMLFLFSKIQDLIGLQNELSKKNETWSDILQSVPIGLLVYREENGIRTTLSINRVLLEFANNAGTKLDSLDRNWTEAELALIFNKDIFHFSVEEDIPLVSTMIKESLEKTVGQCIFRLRGSNSENTLYVYSVCSSKKSEDGAVTYYITFQNVTEAENRRIEVIENQKQLYKLSYYDGMTEVKNRNAYNNYVEQCKTMKLHHVGIAFCDLNGLKQTNDNLGHNYGDLMIKRFVSILGEFFEKDHIYRLSGDEFLVIEVGILQEDFSKKMSRLLNRVREEENIASIGYIWKEEVSNLQRRTTQAEEIMYIEKRRYYERSATMNSKHRPRMLNVLLEEFKEGRFLMYLQPKTSIDGTKIIGAEALARKYDSKGNILLPYGFVPQLESEKLIPTLDFFMLEETCKFLQDQHQKGNEDFSVSVNISRITIIENDFIERVSCILNQYDFSRNNIEFEITESNKTMDAFRLEDCLIQLKKLGVKISIDDMGNDYSSLNLLTLEGFDWVKLDRSLILQLEEKKARVLIKHIIETCHDLGLKVIAEGVEKEEDRKLLMDMKCDAYQGYLKSKPISVEEFLVRFLS